MKNKFSNFITALKAEHIKKRGTGFYWTSAIIGLLSPILFGIVAIVEDSPEIKRGIPYNLYLQFIENTIQPFAYFFFPLLIIITVSRITQLDHRNGGWQLMETQPSFKFSIYFSKFFTMLMANLIAILSFIIFSILICWILTFLITVPELSSHEIPFFEIAWLISRLFVASLLISAFQFVISVVIPSFIWSIIIGFFGLLLTVFLKPFNLVPAWYPYEILSKIAANPKGSDLGNWFTFTEYISVIGSIIVLYVGFQWYSHKNFKAAFFAKFSRTATLLVVLVVFGGLSYWILQPNQMPEMHKTTISAKFKSDQQYKTAYLIDFIVQDTIAVIPIKENSFHYTFEKPVVNDYYSLVFDGRFNKNVYMSTNDSIFIEGNLYENKDDFKIKGTRLAENQMATQTEFNWSMAEYYLNENINIDKPDEIAREIYSEWKDACAEPSDFRTVDNYIAKQDFADRTKKLASVKYLNLWNELLKKRAAIYPNEKTIEGENIQKIRKSLSLTDESLLSTPDYFEYVRSQLLLSNKEEISDNAKALQSISKLKNGSFKDKMLFWQMKKSIEETTSTEERNVLLATYGDKFGNTKYQNRIIGINKTVESLGRGKDAPLFDATTIDKKGFELASLKGKFVIIDVWATWCGPCKRQSPFFEKFAVKYKKENIQFVALSTDQRIDKWFVEAKTKSKSVLQVHANNPEQFGRDYNVESIPRFILIGPDGKFVNARLPFPEDSSFEILLRKELGLAEEK